MRQVIEATLAWVNAQKKAGKILDIYAIPRGRTAVICNHPSAEDAAQTIVSIPMGGLMTFEVHALADFDETMNA